MSIRTEQLPITDEVIAAATRYTSYVMIARSCRRRGDRGHKRPHKRNGVWGVRTGRRGAGFTPLLSCCKQDHGDGVVIYTFEV